MPAPSNFAFIGPRGAGKSRFSRKFAKHLDRLLLSIDVLICYEAGGRSITEIVAEEGWSSFREREYELLKKVCHMPGVVIDCGGGILVDLVTDDAGNFVEVFSERKAAILKQSCTTIYVRRDIPWLLSRELSSSHRPVLAVDYEAILRRRLPWYERAADYTMDMRDRETGEGLEELFARFG